MWYNFLKEQHESNNDQLVLRMDTRRPSQDIDGSRHPRTDRLFPGIRRWKIRHHTGTAMRIVRLRHADCRQLHQRPLRLSERQRPCRPPRPRTRLCTRLDYPHSHETGNSRNAYILLPHGLRPAATMLGTLTPRRLGTDTVRTALRNIRILIYHHPLLSRMGRPTRIGFLRLHPRRRNLLHTGPCHYGRRMGSLAHLRPGNRHLTGRKQLPRPGTGRSQRQAHTDCPLRRTFRPLPVSGIRHSSRLAQPMVCLQR